MSIMEEVGKTRAQRGGGRFVVENSPVGSSQSNGVAEKAIQSVQGQVRVLKLALEKRRGIQIPHRHSVMPWVVEYAAFLLNRYEVGHDGKTVYERSKGKRAKTLGIEFGEGVHWMMKQAKGALGKLDSLWSDGVYLGIEGKTGEIIVGDAEGVWRTRTIRRKLEAERWRHTHASTVVGVPRNHVKLDLEPDGAQWNPEKSRTRRCRTMNVWTSTSGSRTLKLERNGGSRPRSVRRTRMRTTSEAAREHSHLENLEKAGLAKVRSRAKWRLCFLR